MSSGEEEIDGKPIGELRVIDLRELLDKRGLSKTGSKNTLVKRLREYVQKERMLEEQSKELDGAPNMEMKSCGSDLVAEYLEQQQAVLQKAKKEAEAARATLSSEASSDEQEAKEESENVVAAEQRNQEADVAAGDSSATEHVEKSIARASTKEHVILASQSNLNVNNKNDSSTDDMSDDHIAGNADNRPLGTTAKTALEAGTVSNVESASDKSMINLHSLRNVEQVYALNERISADLVQSPGAPVTECDTSDKHGSSSEPPPPLTNEKPITSTSTTTTVAISDESAASAVVEAPIVVCASEPGTTTAAALSVDVSQEAKGSDRDGGGTLNLPLVTEEQSVEAEPEPETEQTKSHPKAGLAEVSVCGNDESIAPSTVVPTASESGAPSQAGNQDRLPEAKAEAQDLEQEAVPSKPKPGIVSDSLLVPSESDYPSVEEISAQPSPPTSTELSTKVIPEVESSSGLEERGETKEIREVHVEGLASPPPAEDATPETVPQKQKEPQPATLLELRKEAELDQYFPAVVEESMEMEETVAESVPQEEQKVPQPATLLEVRKEAELEKHFPTVHEDMEIEEKLLESVPQEEQEKPQPTTIPEWRKAVELEKHSTVAEERMEEIVPESVPQEQQAPQPVILLELRKEAQLKGRHPIIVEGGMEVDIEKKAEGVVQPEDEQPPEEPFQRREALVAETAASPKEQAANFTDRQASLALSPERITEEEKEALEALEAAAYSKEDEVEISAPPDAVDELLGVDIDRSEQKEEPPPAPVVEAEELVQKPQKKRKWKTTTVGKRTATTVGISSDSLKEIVLEAPPVDSEEAQFTEDATMQLDYDESPTNKRTQLSKEDLDEESTEPVTTVPDVDIEELQLEEVKENFEKLATTLKAPIRSVSPPRHPTSNIIHVRCLTRPYTTKSLHELLAQYGNYSTDEFWIDGIKSHCLVKYEDVESAVRARNALHNVQWPPSNPKVLRVDFGSEDDLDRHRGLAEKKPASLQNVREPAGVQIRPEPPTAAPAQVAGQRMVPGELPAKSEQERQSPERSIWPRNREWDRGKSTREMPLPPEDLQRLEPPQRKRIKEEEVQSPAKLLDELFRKTKCTPCIYWLPLTEEQVEEREKERKQREAERAERVRKANEEELLMRKEREKRRGSPSFGRYRYR